MTPRRSLPYDIAVVVFWSSGFVGATLAAGSAASVFLILFWRFVLAAALLAPFLLREPKPIVRDLVREAGIGLLAMAGFIGFVVKAIDLGAPTGTTALIAALQPLATAALAGVFLGEVVTRRGWLGLVVGLAGVAVAVNGAPGNAPWFAYLFPFIAMACVVAATILAKSGQTSLSLPVVLFAQSTAAALAMLPLALLDGPIAPIAEPAFAASVLWFTVLSTLGAYGAYWLCLRRTSATHVASLIYFTPPVAAFWVWAMFGEPFGWPVLAGFALCLLGVWLANRPPPGNHS